MLISYLQSAVQSILNTVLEIAAVSDQGLNLDPLDQADKVVFPKKVRENTGFHEEFREKFVLASQK